MGNVTKKHNKWLTEATERERERVREGDADTHTYTHAVTPYRLTFFVATAYHLYLPL